MNFPELRNKLMVILKEANIGIEQISLFDKLSVDEVWELSAKIGTELPRYPDIIIDEAKERVFNAYTEDELAIMLNNQINRLFKLLLRKQNTEEHILLLVFYLIYVYKMTTNKSFIEEFQKITPYFNSHIMYSMSIVRAEVESNPVKGITKELNDWYLRVDYNYDLIPTTTTTNNFSKFL